MKRMLRLIGLMMALTILLLSIAATGICESVTWDCPNCGRTGNTGPFCGSCGTAQSDALQTKEPTPEPTPESTPEPTPEPTPDDPRQLIPVLSEIYPGTDARLKDNGDKSIRVASYTGPGKAFVSSGGYKPYEQVKLTVFYEENGWVLTNFEYQTSTEKYIYLPKKSFSQIDDIPTVGSPEYFSAAATERIIPSWGPGSGFATESGLACEKGTELKVFFRENEYYYAEYKSEKGNVRMWLPAESVEIKGTQP